jgi:protein-disulfide isomerase
MLRPASVFDGRFRVLGNFAAAANSIAPAEELSTGRRVWLVLLSLTASAEQVADALERQARFALGVPGLARPIASGVDGGLAFVAFAAPAAGSVAEARGALWPARRVAALATRIADALAPLHDQGIAHGCVCPELIVESDSREVLFGFGVAALATRFGAPGDASQISPPAYRAPELRSALLAPSPASDMFALGALLQELLCGALNPEKSDESPAKSLNPALSALLERATAAEPRARPNDVRAFARELALAAAESDALASAPSAERSASEHAPRDLSSSASGAESNRAASTKPSAESSAAQSLARSSEPSAESSAVQSLDPSSEPNAESSTAALEPSLTPLATRLPAAPLPGAPPFALPPTPAPNAAHGSTWGALLVVLGGLLLMSGSIVGATVFAFRHARPVKPPAVPVVTHAPPPASPRLTIPGPSDDELPPVPSPPKKKTPPRVVISHAPLVPPGVGPSSFAEEARAALPVTGNEPIWGTRNAPLSWLLFGDLECPPTRHAWRALEAAKVTFGDDLRIVFHHRPLPEHAYAQTAARVLAGLARKRGSAAFFSVLHKIAQDDAALTDERLSALLAAVGYGNESVPELTTLGGPTVDADLQLAGQFGLRATPLSFLNGLRVEGERTPDELERLLLDERRTVTWALATGTPAKDLYATRTSSNLIGLGEQDSARVCAPVLDSPTRGPADALVTLVEFSDFECPYCKQVEPTLRTLLSRYPRTLRVVWKDYPLPQHKRARLLANFAADAFSRGASAGFWAVHDGLFARGGDLDDGALGELAGKAGLDSALLLVAAHAGAHDAAIHRDLALGEQLGVTGTPTFFANGRRIQGALGLEQFDALIRSELASAEHIVARGVARDKLYRLVCDGD